MNIFYWRLILINQVFVRSITFGFRCRKISVKLLVFGVNILLDTNTKILMITKLRNFNDSVLKFGSIFSLLPVIILFSPKQFKKNHKKSNFFKTNKNFLLKLQLGYTYICLFLLANAWFWICIHRQFGSFFP